MNVLKNPFITQDLFHLAFSLFWSYNKALLALIEISQWHTSLSNTYRAKHHCNGSFLHSSPAFQLPCCQAQLHMFSMPATRVINWSPEFYFHGQLKIVLQYLKNRETMKTHQFHYLPFFIQPIFVFKMVLHVGLKCKKFISYLRLHVTKTISE